MDEHIETDAHRGTGTLVLLRHGESEANATDVLAGWSDVRLTQRGRDEAIAAGRVLVAHGLCPDVVHTSVLSRAGDTADAVLATLGRRGVPVRRSWRLNERHYGALQGRTREAVRAEVGVELLTRWRRSYTDRPPPMASTDPRHPRRDPRYRAVDPVDLPSAESIADVRARVVPWWRESVVPDLLAGRTVLLVSHGNTLRAVQMHLEGLGPDRVPTAEIPTGRPIRVELDAACLPVVAGGELLEPTPRRRHPPLVGPA